MPSEIGLPLKSDQLIGLAVHSRDDPDAHEAHHQEQHGDDEEPNEEFGVHGRPNPGDEIDRRPNQRWEMLRVSFARSSCAGLQLVILVLRHIVTVL
ncbi:MAG: hypothetical protein ACRDH8_11935 [Actinomycetota bacterium]